MYTHKLSILFVLTDTRLQSLLESVPPCERFEHETVAAHEFSATDAASADIIVLDAALADPLAVRAACPKKAFIFCCSGPEDGADAIQAAYESADEVWPKPVSGEYAVARWKRTLQSLKDVKDLWLSRLWLDAVIDNSPDLIWFKDVRGAHLKVNNAFCDAVGKNKTQIEGRGHYYIWDIPPEEYAQGEYVCLETEEIVMARRERSLFDEQVKCKQGLRQFKTYKAPLINDEGRLLGTVGVAQDVTRLAATTNLLSQSMANFNAAIDTAHMHYWKLNAMTGEAELGALFASEMGLPQNLTNYPDCLVERGNIHADSIEMTLNAHQLLREGRHGVTYDVRLVRPDGTDRWRRVKYAMPADGGDSSLPLLGISEDIDDYKRMEKAFSISAMQNGIMSWTYDIENRMIYSIMNPMQTFGFCEQFIENVPDVFALTSWLHTHDVAAMLELHHAVMRGEKTASAVTRWRADGETDWTWFRLTYTTIFNTAGDPVRAVGSALDITEQIRADQRYSMQLAYRDSITRDSIATLLLNITGNRILELHGDALSFANCDSVDGLFATIAGFATPAGAKDAAQFYDRQAMLDAFQNGTILLNVEYMQHVSASGYTWLRVTANLIKNPETGDVEAFVHVEDIDDQKIVEACYNTAASRDHDSLICVDGDTGRVRVIYHHDSATTDVDPAREQCFADCVKLYHPLVEEGDQPAYAQAMTLETIMNGVRKTGSHSVQFRMREVAGTIHHKRVRFTSMDPARPLLCMVVSDITDVFEVEQRKNALLRKALDAANDSSKSKTAFLANMSHEIRTPMNTIIGMSEILLGKDLAPEVAGEIATIQNAGKGLLGIINDILDFSKVESGKFELCETPYMPTSLLMDVNSMSLVWLADKPIHFFMTVNPDVPVRLRGDDTRLRQILMNIISNAVKYTIRGYISLNVDGAFLPDGRYRLKMKVVDTGIGIRQDDLPRLFVQFNRVDTKKNRHIIGTGLGLALSRNFATMMGGDITVESKYGSGSTFTITVVQSVEENEPLARIKAVGQNILLYEPDDVLSRALSGSLQRLGIGCVICRNVAEIPEQQGITHVVLRLRTLPEAQAYLGNLCRDENIILLLENGETAEPRYMCHKQLQLALFCLQIADVLNGENRASDTRRPSLDRSQIEPYPGVKVLIVDDNVTNLQVAKGLFTPYQMDIETAINGFDAIEKVRHTHYDLIFMDHMMPGLDGVETTAHIRALPGDYFRDVPIIALTANAMLGAKESFLQQGMTDFLAKPIEMSRLNRLLKVYAAPAAHKAAQNKSNTPGVMAKNDALTAGEHAAREAKLFQGLPSAIEGLDTSHALAVYRDVDVYHEILRTFGSDMIVRLPQLSEFVEKEELAEFTISVHAIKSAARSVGANSIGDTAEEMETLGANGAIDSIRTRFPAFLDELEKVTAGVSRYVAMWLSPTAPSQAKKELVQFDAALTAQLKAACADMDYDLAEKTLQKMDAWSYTKAIQLELDKMKTCCADFDYAALDAAVAEL